MVAARLLPAELAERQRIDRYELVAEIASGGMATVYLARRAGVGGFQRFVAVKRLHPHLAADAEFVQMFLDEARVAALIHHPNVVSITEVGASDRGYYLVMDYIEGDTLARLMSDCAEVGASVPLGIGLRIVIDMLTGLHAAHELHDDQGNPTGLVHRDVSPQNILVGLDGVTRISDFGVARARTRLADTRVGQLKGKIAYMAPEQAAGDDMLDRRADVFAAGIVLWELLTGKRLFRASNDAATLSRVVSEHIFAPTEVVLGLDPRISDACMKALERPLTRRIASAAEFADMLESAATRAGVLASGRDVSAYMASVLGEEIRRHREAIRRWLSESEDSEERSDAVSARVPTSGPMRRIQFSPEGERFPSSPRSASSLVDSSDLTVVAPRHDLRRFYFFGAALVFLLVILGAIALWTGREQPAAVHWSHWSMLRQPGYEGAWRHHLDGITAVDAEWRRASDVATVGQSSEKSARTSLKESRKGSRSVVDGRTPLSSPRVPKPQVDLTNPYTR